MLGLSILEEEEKKTPPTSLFQNSYFSSGGIINLIERPKSNIFKFLSLLRHASAVDLTNQAGRRPTIVQPSIADTARRRD